MCAGYECAHSPLLHSCETLVSLWLRVGGYMLVGTLEYLPRIVDFPALWSDPMSGITSIFLLDTAGFAIRAKLPTLADSAMFLYQ